MTNFNILVVYRDHTKRFSCMTRREFGFKVAKFFGLDRSEMLFYEKSSNTPISINDLRDKMTVVIKDNVKPTRTTNGENPEKTSLNPAEIPDAGSTQQVDSPGKVPDIVELKRKLTENRVLSGSERKFLLNLVDEYSDSTSSPSRKRRRVSETDVIKVNKKLQVSFEKTSTYSQTDRVLFDKPPEPSTSKDLIEESKKLARLEKKDGAKVRKLMDRTFEERRQFILRMNPVLHRVKEKYPLLFSTEEVINELNRIFYDKKDEEFLANIKLYSSAILSCQEEDTAIASTINDAKNRAITVSQKKYAMQVGAILSISNAVREKRTYLHTEDEPCKKDNFPRIEAPCEVSKIFEDVITYKIIAEGIVLCEASTFPEAILCLIACYFIFNISYPEQSFNTLVFMEKVFLDANDTDVNDIDDDTNQFIRYVKLKTNPNS